MRLDPGHLLSIALEGLIGTTPAAGWQYQPVGGGSINASYRITAPDKHRWFCKLSDAAKYPGLLDTERKGLTLLRSRQEIRVPAVIACTQAEDKQVLVLEWIEEGLRTDAFWKRFGEQLARLHRVTGPSFGLDHDNYMGALPQNNSLSPDWTSFFRDRRLRPQVELAASKGLLPPDAGARFDRLYERLPDLFPPELPALLHGDLWSGNFLCDDTGQPVLIDPAVYFGHRSVDLAMTTLFGGFDAGFYDAYNWHYPFPREYRRQWEVANLYPLLIHLNLFGPGYVGQILHTIERF